MSVRSVSLVFLLLLAAILPAQPAQAQEEGKEAATTVATPTQGGQTTSVGQRWAVLIGVDDYQWARKLQCCGADVRALAEQLTAAGFARERVFLLHDKADATRYRPTKTNVDDNLKLVLGLVEKNDLLVVAFSGHGVHLDGKSYLCPQDARLDDPQTLVSVDGVYELLEECPASLKLLIVDACRNDPRSGSERSLTPDKDAKAFVADFASSLERPPHGILQMTSCAPGEIAREDQELNHGVFMHFLLSGLTGQADSNRNGRVSLTELYQFTNDQTKTYVARKFFDSQRPGLKGDLYDDFDLAVARLDVRPQPPALQKVITNSIGMKLVLVPAGSFQMGSSQQEVDQMIRQNPKDPSDWYTRESPRHAVKITRPFYLGMYEVTVGQFRQFVEAEAYRTDAERDGKGGWGWHVKESKQSPDYSWRNAGYPQTDQHPVVNVSWNDAAAFCQWLGGQENRTYRLPTEAEWEYACRAETTTRWNCGNDPEALARIANVADGTATAAGLTFQRGAITARDGYTFTAPVGRYQLNAFGLGDLHGNAAEWCQDWYDGEYYAKSPSEDPPGPPTGSLRVFRGGCWYGSALGCRSALRIADGPVYRDGVLGFRVASVPSGQ